MRMIKNDTFGEISREELAALRATAHKCRQCGMLADVDPEFHQSRYGHAPSYTGEDGKIRAWINGRWETEEEVFRRL